MIEPNLSLTEEVLLKIDKELKERTRAMREAGEPYWGYSLIFHFSPIGRVVEVSVDGSDPIIVDDDFSD
jgi:hypothetical protein